MRCPRRPTRSRAPRIRDASADRRSAGHALHRPLDRDSGGGEGLDRYRAIHHDLRLADLRHPQARARCRRRHRRRACPRRRTTHERARVAPRGRWRRAGLDLNVAINVAPQEILSGGLMPFIYNSLSRTTLPHDAITIEVTADRSYLSKSSARSSSATSSGSSVPSPNISPARSAKTCSA